MYSVLMSYEITVAYERTSAYVTLVRGTCRMGTNVYCELTLRREREGTSVAHQWLFGDVTPTVCRHVALHRETFLTNVAGIRPLSRMYPLMSIKTALLSKPFQAQFTLEGSFSCVRPHVHFQVRLPAKTRFAHRTMIWFVARMKLHVYIVRRSGG